MKVLYIGPYKDGTGWAHSAIENILALDAAGVDVVPRPLKLNDTDGEVPKRILELESKSHKGCDISIQNSLPHHTDFNGEFKKNIAYYFTETSHFRNSTWAERLNLLDEAWVPCTSVMNASIESNVIIPIAIVPVPCSIDKYQKKYEKLNLPHLTDKFTFYTIGEINQRKNLFALLMAFHLEFKPDEPVELVIKGNIPGLNASEVDTNIGNICNKVKDQLKLYKHRETYLRETIITQTLNEEQIMQLHHTCDCYVSPSYGEGWNMPAFDAMAMGKTPICTAQGGPLDFLFKQYEVYEGDGNVGLVEEEGGWLVEAQSQPVFNMTNTMHDIYVGNEEWSSINIRSLRKAMRRVFEDEEERKKRADIGVNRAYDFSSIAVGTLMKELLENEKQAILYDRSSKVREKHNFQTVAGT